MSRRERREVRVITEAEAGFPNALRVSELEDVPAEAIGRWLQAMTRAAPGYTEIANEGGIRWHTRTDALDDPDSAEAS